MNRSLSALVLAVAAQQLAAQVTTTGFPNQAQAAAPGTLLSDPISNDSAGIGRTTTLNYVNGWLIVGAEGPGSAEPYDLSKRVYDVSDPANPIRRFPSDFNLTYPGNFWYANNDGWNAHGSAQSGSDLLPIVMRVDGFGGVVEMGGTNGIPNLTETALGYNRSSQAGPWVASMPWYGTPNQVMEIEKVSLNGSGVAQFQTLAAFDHVGSFGGGDWHPMFFGDLLIYARSGAAASDGVVVYRLDYHANGEGTELESVTPQFVGSLQGGFQGYWPNLFSDGAGLHVIGSTTDILTSADITAAADPLGDGSVVQGPSLTIPNFTNASYPVYQDQFGFIHNRKINMTEFLAGNPDPIVLTLDEAGTGVDTSQMSLPLGNLWVTGGYPHPGLSQGMAIWVHQQAPDTTAPAVTYHVPQANRAGYPRFAPLSFLLHEHPRHGGMRNGIDFTVRPVDPGDDSLGAFVPGYLIHDFSGVVTFTPAEPLAGDTTYQVDFLSDDSDPQNPVGFFDAAGNAVEPYSFRFSTGGGVLAATPPVVSEVSADTYHPAPGETVGVSATAAPGSAGGPLEYRFNFGGVWSAWGPVASASHSYPAAGRQRVLVQVRDAGLQPVTVPLNLLVIDAPPGPLPTQSGTMAVGDDPGGRRLWVVNPDADSVSVLEAVGGALVEEHPVGDHPRSVARDGYGRYWVICEGSDEIRILNPDGTPHATLPLSYGSAPFGIAASADGAELYVTLYGSAELQRYAAADPMAPPATVATPFPTPRAIAVSGNGQRVFVTRFISPELEAEIAEFDGDAPGLGHVRTFRLASANPVDGGDRASGVPNYLSGIALSPDGTRAAVVSKQDNIQRGLAYGTGDLTFETTVRSVISFLDLSNNTEIPHSRRDFDNSDSPSAVAYTPLGDSLLVTLQGNNRLVGLDALSLAPVTGPVAVGSTLTSPAVKTMEAATGLAPQGVLVDAAAGRLFVQNFMGRSVTVLDGGPLLDENRTSLPEIALTATVGAEPLAADVLLGKRIFYNAADPRMSAEGYISCASCHIDGGSDQRAWDFTGRGEGLRRTTDLRGKSGIGQGNVHWSGNFDEIQDFEHDIRGPFGGGGFLGLTPSEFSVQHPDPGTAKAGLSADLDALAAYVSSLGTQEIPRSPHRQTDGSMTAAGLRGRDIFAALSCTSCHSGDSFSDSQNSLVSAPSLHAVGTISGISGGRLGAELPGIDTPGLAGLHANRVFLHHGQAADLGEMFAYAGGELLPAAGAELLGAGVSVSSDNPAEGGGGFVRGMLGGAFVEVTGPPGSGVRFTGVDGGSGGAARLALRHILTGGGTTVVRVNGNDQNVNLLPEYPANAWMTSGWRWLTVDVTLDPGETNVIEILRGPQEYANFQLNAILVSHADMLAEAAPHRAVLSLTVPEQADLMSYLLELDGSANQAPVPPDPDNVDATLAAAPGTETPLASPFVDFEIQFSGAVTGLAAGDFLIGGTAGATVANLITLTEGTHYRLRLTGFSQAGSLTVQLPAGSADGPLPGSVNNASALVSLDYLPPAADDLAGLSDEFDDAASIADWQRNDTAEGWNADKLETWDINATSPGRMRLMPYASSWYQDFTGAFAYKEVTGDFIATINLDVLHRDGSGRPDSEFSLAGIMVRASRGLANAAPVPAQPGDTVLPWPPDGYSTGWQPGTENYIFLSYGHGAGWLTSPDGNNPARWHYEVKTTTNGISDLYPRTHGVPENEPNATLQIVRRGSTFLLLRRHGAGPWIIENRFERTDLPETLQVGITTYTDWATVSAGWGNGNYSLPFHQNRIVNTATGTPDLIADVEYMRLRRPPAELSQAALQAVPVTGQGAFGGIVQLAGQAGISPHLGDAAAAPVESPPQTFAQWLGTRLTPQQLADPSLTDPGGTGPGNTLPNVLEYLMGSAPTLEPVADGMGGANLRYLVPHNPQTTGWRLIVETSDDLAEWAEVAASENGAAPTGTGVEGAVSLDPPVTIVGPGAEEEGDTRFYRARAVPQPVE